MAGIPLPGVDELPEGPRRELTKELHKLYDGVGRPSLRWIEDAVPKDAGRRVVSHSQIGELLHGRIAKWVTLEPVVRALAGRQDPARDPDSEARRFHQLWLAVPQPGETNAPPPNVETRVRSVYVIGGVTGEEKYQDLEKVQLAEVGKPLGAAIARGGADLIACSTFDDSIDLYALMGYVQSSAGKTVRLHSPRHPEVDAREKQLWRMLELRDPERIRNWHYPAPDDDQDGESWGQAWLLCQLMALDQADAVVAIGGRPGKTANTLLHLAEARQKPLIPFEFLGGAARLAFNRRNWERAYPGLDHRKLTDKNAVAEVMDIVNQMVSTRVRREDSYSWPPRRVFVSRARPDAAFALELDDYLVAAGLEVLFGEKEIRPDRTVEFAIEDAMLRADLFIVLWSRSYAASRYCHDEIELALRRYRIGELRIWIVGLDDSDVVPPGARNIPRLEARTPQDLVSVIRGLLSSGGVE